MFTPYTPYFWQTKEWAQFWLAANPDANHRVFTLSHTYKNITIECWIYMYPWHLKQSFFYIPQGPIVRNLYYVQPIDASAVTIGDEEAEHARLRRRITICFKYFMQKLKTLAKKEGVSFIKIDLDDSLAKYYDIETRETGVEWMQHILGDVIDADNEKEVVLQQTPDSVSDIIQQNHAALFEKQHIQLSNKRIMYPMNTAVNTSTFARIPYKSATDDLPLLQDFYHQNQEYFKSISNQTKTKTRKSFNKGWKVQIGNPLRQFDQFWEVFSHTKERQQFSSQNKEYFRKFASQKFARSIVVSDDRGNPHSVWLGFSQSDFCVYMYGGSTPEGLKNFAPHLVHVAGMFITVNEQRRWYDLGGYDPDKGYGFFKSGYRGTSRHFPHAIDLCIKPWKTKATNLLIHTRKKLS